MLVLGHVPSADRQGDAPGLPFSRCPLTPFVTAVLGQPTVSITDQTLTGHMAVSQETVSSSTWPSTALDPWPIPSGRHGPPHLATMVGLFAFLRGPPWNEESPCLASLEMHNGP